MQELKEKYNLAVNQKSELQAHLLHSEEEKLNASKAAIEFQIENDKLREQLHNLNFEHNTKGLHSEVDAMEWQVSREKSEKQISEMQDAIDRAIEEKKEIEVEYMVLKKNYFNKCQELDEQRSKNEQIGLELVSLVKENKTLVKGGSPVKTQKTGVIHDEYEKNMKKITVMEIETGKLKEALLKTSAELEKARNEKAKAHIAMEQMKVEYDNKKVGLEKEYVNLAKHKDGQIHSSRKTGRKRVSQGSWKSNYGKTKNWN